MQILFPVIYKRTDLKKGKYMEKRKSKYISPEIEIIIFDCEDVMTSSSPNGGYTPDYEPDNNTDSDW